MIVAGVDFDDGAVETSDFVGFTRESDGVQVIARIEELGTGRLRGRLVVDLGHEPHDLMGLLLDVDELRELHDAIGGLLEVADGWWEEGE